VPAILPPTCPLAFNGVLVALLDEAHYALSSRAAFNYGIPADPNRRPDINIQERIADGAMRGSLETVLDVQELLQRGRRRVGHFLPE
jgi:hypothetical protein